jgi:hypothetical protein
MPTLVSRFDVASLGTPQRTSQGFLRIPAYLTRVGVLEYRRADGELVRELRPGDEVMRAQSLATLSAAPVTDLHPTVMISPANVREFSVGHVSDEVKPQGALVAAIVTVEDEDAIAAVERGDRRELSCGYQCRIDATPGVHEGERYDQVQRDIVYNHVALLPRGAGRAGPEVALRIDAADGDAAFRLDADDALGVSTIDAPASDEAELEADDEEADEVDEAEDEEADDDEQEAPTYEELLARVHELEGRFDAVLLESDPARFVRDDSDHQQLVAERDALQARVDGLTVDLAETQRALGEARDTEQRGFHSAVHLRAVLVERARRALPSESLDGLTTRQVHEAVLRQIDSKFDCGGKTDDYVQCRFDVATANLDRGSSHLDAVRRVLAPRVVTRADDRFDAPVPAWMRPLSYTKNKRKEL